MINTLINPFQKPLQNLTESGQEAQKHWNDNPQDQSPKLYNEWAVTAMHFVLQQVEDPVDRMKVLRDVLAQTFMV